jgi:SAM-dependent methyltransferase
MQADVEFPFALSDPNGGTAPVWTGKGFRLHDGSLVPVLAYSVGASGWSDDLTGLHEESAGDRHYIDVASRRHAVTELSRYLRVERPVVMEVGCSSGYFLTELSRELPEAYVIGADYVLGPLEALAKKRQDLPLLRFDLAKCPLPDACLDGLVALNVLEHIEDDQVALDHIFRALKPGGAAVLEVPAGPELFDPYDKALMHHRRYDLAELTSKATAAGFSILSASHLGFLLYPAFALVKRRNQRKGAVDVKANIAVSAGDNPLLHLLMRIEDGLRRLIPLPFGIRCLVTLRRPLE